MSGVVISEHLMIVNMWSIDSILHSLGEMDGGAYTKGKEYGTSIWPSLSFTWSTNFGRSQIDISLFIHFFFCYAFFWFDEVSNSSWWGLRITWKEERQVLEPQASH